MAFASGMAAIHAAVRHCAPSPGTPCSSRRTATAARSPCSADTLTQEGVTRPLRRRLRPGRAGADARRRAPSGAVARDGLEPTGARRRPRRDRRISASEHDVPVLVDSTFTTPYLIRPLSLGAACVIHSATKYLGGHGDVTGGVVACRTRRAGRGHAQLAQVHRRGARACWRRTCRVRGIRTLSLRMARQCANAAAVADALAQRSAHRARLLPGLAGQTPTTPWRVASFPRACSARCSRSRIRDADKPAVMRFLERLELIRAAPTLGDCFSLVLYPVIASHRGLTPEAAPRTWYSRQRACASRRASKTRPTWSPISTRRSQRASRRLRRARVWSSGVGARSCRRLPTMIVPDHPRVQRAHVVHTYRPDRRTRRTPRSDRDCPNRTSRRPRSPCGHPGRRSTTSPTFRPQRLRVARRIAPPRLRLAAHRRC